MVGLPLIASSDPTTHELSRSALRMPPSPPIELDLSAEMAQARDESLSRFRQEWQAEDREIIGELGSYDMALANESLFSSKFPEEGKEAAAESLLAIEGMPVREPDLEALAAN